MTLEVVVGPLPRTANPQTPLNPADPLVDLKKRLMWEVKCLVIPT